MIFGLNFEVILWMYNVQCTPICAIYPEDWGFQSLLQKSARQEDRSFSHGKQWHLHEGTPKECERAPFPRQSSIDVYFQEGWSNLCGGIQNNYSYGAVQASQDVLQIRLYLGDLWSFTVDRRTWYTQEGLC